MGGNILEFLKTSFILIIVLLASIYDHKKKRIPNLLIVIGFLSSIMFDLYFYPISSKDIFIKIIGICVLFFFGMLRLMGLGDIKLWMVITAYWGIIISSAIITGASLLLIIHRCLFNEKEKELVYLSVWQIMHYKKLNIIPQREYPFAPYIFVFTFVYASWIIAGGV